MDNSAGATADSGVIDGSKEDWDKVIQTDLNESAVINLEGNAQ